MHRGRTDVPGTSRERDHLEARSISQPSTGTRVRRRNARAVLRKIQSVQDGAAPSLRAEVELARRAPYSTPVRVS
eukprot:COSAG01_NODE_16790_length_1203_cov_14.633152_1_plen_74_part_10